MRSGKLTARGAMTTKPGRYGDGAGLWLSVADSGSARWVYRFTISGKVSEMGLGSRDLVSLAEARELASAARKVAKSGVSPVAAKKAAAPKPLFGQIAEALIEAKRAEWRNGRHAAQWRSTLTEHAAAIWDRPIDTIDTEAVLSVLRPLWVKTPETGNRVRGRIEAVLAAAKTRGLRSGENPAQWRGHLANLLPKRGKLSRGHLAAMPYEDVPSFVAKLREQDDVNALALEYLILTATRLSETLGARWSEIDLVAKVWTIPPERMKAGALHRVPLADRAVQILERLATIRTGDLLFEGRGGAAASGRNLRRFLRRMGVDMATASLHGFRSSFRDCAGDRTNFQREVAEACLAHAVGNAVERSYRRGDALAKRRVLMTAWANYCETSPMASNIIPLRGV